MRWIIGDIHGMLRPLETMIDLIRLDDAAPQFIFAGDYINRGPHSRGVIELLLSLENARFVRGNHDDVFDLILHGHSYTFVKNAIDPVAAFKWFIDQGLDQTLLSYGIEQGRLSAIERRPGKAQIDALFEVVPPSHRKFVRSLEPAIEFEDCFIAHAFWHPDEGTEGPRLGARLAEFVPLRQHLVWTRFTETQIKQEKPWQRRGFFGHTPVLHYTHGNGGNVPLSGPKICLIDTGVALGPGGRLSAFCVEEERFVQVDHFAKPVT